MKRVQQHIVIDLRVGQEGGFCDACEPSDDNEPVRPFAVLRFGPVWMEQRVVLCRECYVKLGVELALALAPARAGGE